MILVILGTQDKSFHRLLKAVDNAVEHKVINDEIIVQAGYTKYKSEHMKIFDLIPMEEFNKLIRKADLVITHGGVGTIMSAIKARKKVIAVARLQKYGEHTNDHQKQIIHEFVREGYILECENLDCLDKTIKESETFTPKKYLSDNEKMIKLITNFIEENEKG